MKNINRNQEKKIQLFLTILVNSLVMKKQKVIIVVIIIVIIITIVIAMLGLMLKVIKYVLFLFFCFFTIKYFFNQLSIISI